MSKSTVARLLILTLLVLGLGFAESSPKVKAARDFCIPLECPLNYHWDSHVCRCVPFP